MTMQPIGTAQPVLLLQTDGAVPNRASFANDREYTKFLRKLLKEAKGEEAKKKDEKKGKTFNYWELVSLLMLISIPVSALEITIGYGLFQLIKKLATG